MAEVRLITKLALTAVSGTVLRVPGDDQSASVVIPHERHHTGSSNGVARARGSSDGTLPLRHVSHPQYLGAKVGREDVDRLHDDRQSLPFAAEP